MSAAVERRLAQFRAARGSTGAPAPAPLRSAEPPAEAADGQARGGGAPRALKALLWAVLLALAAGLGLALPVGLLAGLYWMHAATRGPAERRRGELSAYSVFNPGCAAIPGTLTAAQLERELLYRPAAGSAG